MAQNLRDLIEPRAFQQFVDQLFLGLKGLGVVTHEGIGRGGLGLTGQPNAVREVTVTVEASGEPSTVALSWTDGALSGSGTPDLTGVFALAGTGVSLALEAATSSPSFVQGDTYTFRLWNSAINFTAFQSGTTGPTLMKLDADALADLARLIATVTKGGLLAYSTGDWLTELASEVYGLERQNAIAVVGAFMLACVATEGPHVVASGQLWVVDASGRRFSNVTGGTIPSGGSVALSFQAETPGAAYNISNGATLTLGTPILPGVTVSNPADPDTGTWLTTQGVDEEADEALRGRCRNRWATLGSGSPEAAYKLWAMTTPGVTRVLVQNDPAGDGNVNVVVAGPAGPVASDVVDAVRADIEPRIPLCSTVDVASAQALSVPIVATVTAKASKRSAVEAAVPTQLTTLEQRLAIGPTTLRLNTIERYLWVDGVTNVAVSDPAADVVLAYGETAVFAPTITYEDAADESEVSV
jgi:uncharacterized phage protein gp47/JayE